MYGIASISMSRIYEWYICIQFHKYIAYILYFHTKGNSSIKIAPACNVFYTYLSNVYSIAFGPSSKSTK